jgi:hypothetical protein
MKKVSIIIAILLFITFIGTPIGTSFAAEETNNNLYPSPKADYSKIEEQILIYNDVEYVKDSLNIGEAAKAGFVSFKNQDGLSKNVVYTMTVVSEGLVSVLLTPMDPPTSRASLQISIRIIDSRSESGNVSTNVDVDSLNKKEGSAGRIVENYSFYAYPGTYYFQVRGTEVDKDNKKVDIGYNIQAIQEVADNSYPIGMGNPEDPDYPNKLGSTILTDSILIESTLRAKHWREPNADGFATSTKYSNSSASFTFTADKTGDVVITLTNNRTKIISLWHEAYQEINDLTADFTSNIFFNIQEIGKPREKIVESAYGETSQSVYSVEAGKEYRLESGITIATPIDYTLELKYPGISSGITTASSWAIDEITKAITAGLKTPKMTQENYKAFASREEFAEIIMKFYDNMGGSNITSGGNSFSDTSNPDIIRAQNAGIINGTSATTFSPNANLTREQLCVMILRALDATNTSYNNSTGFQKQYMDQNNISSWATESVKIINGYQIMNGSGDNLDPKGTVTKEMAMLVLYRAYNTFK